MSNTIVRFFLISAVLFMVSCKKQDTIQQPENNSIQVKKEASVTQPVLNSDSTAASKPKNEKLTEIVFTENEFDFGTINQGDKVMHVFTFKNTGSNDLIISTANGSCGCTVPEFTKDPISPGKTGTMKVSFSSTGKSGPQQKTVTVSANVPNGAQVLTIKANVKVDKTKK